MKEEPAGGARGFGFDYPHPPPAVTRNLGCDIHPPPAPGARNIGFDDVRGGRLITSFPGALYVIGIYFYLVRSGIYNIIVATTMPPMQKMIKLRAYLKDKMYIIR